MQNKKKGGLYMYAKNQNGGLFIERGAYRLHLTGIYNPAEGKDKHLFLAAKELGFKDFPKQFAEVLRLCAEKQYPVFSIYVKDEKKVL